MWCVHAETTDVDSDGRAVCVACGEVLQVRFTREATFEGVRADA